METKKCGGGIQMELYEKVWSLQPDMLAHRLDLTLEAAVRIHALVKKELVNTGVMTPDNSLILRKEAQMKITLDAELTIGGIPARGTGCMGYMPDGTRYKDLVRVFGMPLAGLSPDGKIKAEWYGRINGLDFTIYDYKSSLEPENNTDWHIGGRKKLTTVLLVAYFKKALADAEKGDAQ